jgi:hypothetical protein
MNIRRDRIIVIDSNILKKIQTEYTSVIAKIN